MNKELQAKWEPCHGPFDDRSFPLVVSVMLRVSCVCVVCVCSV